MVAAQLLGLSPLMILIAVGVVVIGSATQASIGIGLGLLAAPILTLIDPGFIPGAISVCVLPLSVGMTLRERDHIDRGILRAVAGRFIGVVAGAVMLSRAGHGVIAIVVGASVLVAVIGSASGLTFRPTRRNLLIAGTASGFSGTVAAIGGPPMALTYQHSDPRILRASLAAFNTIGATLTIPSLVIAGVLGVREVQLAAVLVPGVFVGLWFGRVGIARLPAHRVRSFVLLACASSAIVLLVNELV